MIYYSWHKKEKKLIKKYARITRKNYNKKKKKNKIKLKIKKIIINTKKKKTFLLITNLSCQKKDKMTSGLAKQYGRLRRDKMTRRIIATRFTEKIKKSTVTYNLFLKMEKNMQKIC